MIFSIGDKVEDKTYGTQWEITEFNFNSNLYTLEGNFAGLPSKLSLSQYVLQNNYFKINNDLPVGDNNFYNNQDTCYHDWKVYVGFNHVDEYCTKCNIKREVTK